MRFMLVIICVILFSTRIASADKVINPNVKIKEDAAGNKYFEGKNGTKFGMKEIKLTEEFTHQKPVIDEMKFLDDEEKDLVEKSLKENGRRLISAELKPAKNDYQNDWDRGTVEFNFRKGRNILGDEVFESSNYSFHKIVIPDGTILHDINFSQKNPHTQAIQGKNLYFIQCNLYNVEIDPSWTFDGGLKIHARHREETIDSKIYDVYEVEKDGIFQEVTREEIISDAIIP